MFDVAQSLAGALGSGRGDLTQAAADASRANTPLGSSRSDAILARAAGRALFTEVLLGAVHARLAEIKNVAHG